MVNKKPLTYEELLELQGTMSPELLDKQAQTSERVKQAEFAEKLANLAGKLGQLGGRVVSGGTVEGAVPSTDFTGTLSQPLQQQAQAGDQRISKSMELQKRLSEIRAGKSAAEAAKEKEMYERGAKEKAFKLEEAKFEFDKSKNQNDFALKLKDYGLKAAAEARQGKLTEAQINKIKSDIQTKGIELGIDRAKLKLAADKFALDLYKASEEAKNLSKSLTPAQESADKQAGKDYSEWSSGQQQANFNKAIDQLEQTKKELRTGNITGGVRQYVPSALEGTVMPQAKAARDRVQEVVQTSLKSILGAQFTEKEAKLLLDRAYDISLDETENLKRVERLQRQLEQAQKAKEEQMRYYEENGTLRGFKGKSPKELLELDSGPTTLENPASTDAVRIKSPDGKIRRVPANRVDAALKAGGERVD